LDSNRKENFDDKEVKGKDKGAYWQCWIEAREKIL
jgi:hypothetical protein